MAGVRSGGGLLGCFCQTRIAPARHQARLRDQSLCQSVLVERNLGKGTREGLDGRRETERLGQAEVGGHVSPYGPSDTVQARYRYRTRYIDTVSYYRPVPTPRGLPVRHRMPPEPLACLDDMSTLTG